MSPTPPDWRSLLPALLDFERSPGRYRVLLREPRPLFENLLAVLQLAVGRPVDGLADLGQDPALIDELKRAARFFVRTVLLRPGVDHYTLLGLAPGCKADELREHYRLMIRLTHPDFAAGPGEAWPADAATRINQANDVLSSFERRSDYNATLVQAQPVIVAAAAAKVTPKLPGPLTRRPKKEADAGAGRTGLRVPHGVKIALVSVGALGAAAVLVLNGPSGDSGSLVVRKPQPMTHPTHQTESGLTLVDVATREAQAQAELPQVQTAGAKVAAVSGVSEVVAAAPAPAPLQKPRQARSNAPATEALALQGGGSGEAAKSQTMETGMDAPVAMPASMPVAAAPAPAALPAEAAAPAVSRAALPAPTLAQVQPVLSNLMGSLPGARGENMANWIDADFRAHPDTGRFVSRFNQLLVGQRVTQLGNVRFSSRAQGAQLVVDGVIQLHTLDTTDQASVRDLHLRAYFQPHDGQPVLTHLVAEKLQ